MILFADYAVMHRAWCYFYWEWRFRVLGDGKNGLGFAAWVAGCILEGIPFLPIDPCLNDDG